MKFTTRQFLLLPIVFIVNAWLVSQFAFPALRTYSWQRESNSVLHAQEWIESAVRYCNQANIAVTDQTIDDWICHRLPPDHPAAQILMDPPRQDSWGNPYRTQARKSLDDKPRVYSTGEDGHSNSDGNDPDDIRSWDDKRWRWYAQRQSTNETAFYMIASAAMTIVGFWLVTARPSQATPGSKIHG
jgi:hypothetical protein